MTIQLKIQDLDCNNLTMKQLEDLETSYADDILTSMGRSRSRIISSLHGEASQVTLVPVAAGCLVQCMMTIPEGSTLQSIAREQNLMILESLLQGSAILANVEGASLQIVQMIMLPAKMMQFDSSSSSPTFTSTTLTSVTGGETTPRAVGPTLEPLDVGRHTPHFEGHTGLTLLVTFLCLAACLCCVELLHVVWKCRGRRLVSRWMKPSDLDTSEDESSENGEELPSTA